MLLDRVSFTDRCRSRVPQSVCVCVCVGGGGGGERGSNRDMKLITGWYN